MADGSGFGREVRGRRLELGMSQSRVAEAVGVPTVQIGRWERGEDVPDSARVNALAEALDLDPDTAGTWLVPANPANTVSVLIMGGEPLAPPLEGASDGLEADPWSLESEGRMQQSPGDDGTPTRGRNGKRESNGHPAPVLNGGASSAAVVPVIAGFPDSSMERALRRQARRDERRLRRELTAAGRQERDQAAADERRRANAEAAAIRRGTLPMPSGSHRSPAPAPAGTANTGSVFPVPDTKMGSERVTYQGVGRRSHRHSRLTYPLRIAGTIAALLVLAGALWWAVSSLGDGFSTALDLFGGGDDSVSISGSFGLLLLG